VDFPQFQRPIFRTFESLLGYRLTGNSAINLDANHFHSAKNCENTSSAALNLTLFSEPTSTFTILALPRYRHLEAYGRDVAPASALGSSFDSLPHFCFIIPRGTRHNSGHHEYLESWNMNLKPAPRTQFHGATTLVSGNRFAHRY